LFTFFLSFVKRIWEARLMGRGGEVTRKQQGVGGKGTCRGRKIEM
jgi:hypothetical protein